MSGVSFPQVQLSDVENGLYAYAKFKQGRAEAAKTQADAEAAQQNLTDRAALRDQEGNFASTDPMAQRQAAAAGLVRPGIGGVSSAGGLATQNADQRAGQDHQIVLGATISDAILGMPADKRPAAYQQFLPMMRQSGMNPPDQYPGDAAAKALRDAGFSVQQRMTINLQTPRKGNIGQATDPFYVPGVGDAGASPAAGAQGGDFTQALGGAESGGNPGVVNSGGYAGKFQFGAPRLQEIGVYTPGEGEKDANGKWNGQMNGTFNIPGFPEVKTRADFLGNEKAQRAAFGVHVADIDKAIDVTPGASGLNRNGLRAVAHLGGVQGMQKFVQSGGQYNPADSNGTKLSDYYTKFAQGGPRALQAQLGHPDGPVEAATPAAATQPPVAPPTATTGQGVAVAGPGAPTGTMAVPTAVPVGNPGAPQLTVRPAADTNALTPPPGTPAGQPPPNTLVPPRTPQPQQAAPAAPPVQAGQGFQIMPNGQPVEVPGRPGWGWVDGVPTRIPGYPVKPTITGHRDATITETDDEGNVIRTVQSPDVHTLETAPVDSPEYVQAYARKAAAEPKGPDGRMVQPDMRAHRTPAGYTLNESGQATPNAGGAPAGMPTSTFSGQDAQKHAYEGDRTDIKEIRQAAQQQQAAMPRLNEMAELIPQVASGSAFPEARAKAAAMLESIGVSPETVKQFTGMSSGSAAQLMTKLAISTSGAAAKADLGSNNGIQSTQLYQQANPGMLLLPDANKRVTNMLRVANQQTQDFANGALAHFEPNENTIQTKGIGYKPLTSYYRQWGEQNNPQIAALAMGILNGDPTDKDPEIAKSWKKLDGNATADERAKATALAQRIDRGAGQAQPAQATPQQPAPQQAATAAPPMESRVKGQAYQTPKGPMTWTGTGWLPAQPPQAPH